MTIWTDAQGNVISQGGGTTDNFAAPGFQEGQGRDPSAGFGPAAGAQVESPGVPEGGFQHLGQLEGLQDPVFGQTNVPVFETGSGPSAAGGSFNERLTEFGLGHNQPFIQIRRTPGTQSPDAVDFGRFSDPLIDEPFSFAAPFGERQSDIERQIVQQFGVPLTYGDIQRAGTGAEVNFGSPHIGQQGGGGGPGIQRSQQPMISDDFGGGGQQFSPAVAPQPQGGGQDQFSPSPSQRLGGQPQNPLGGIGMQQLGMLFQQLFGRGPQLGGFGFGRRPLGPVPFTGSRGMMRRPLPPVQMRSPFGRF